MQVQSDLESLYASIKDDEYDIIAQVKSMGSEELYKRMYADEMEELKASFEEDFSADGDVSAPAQGGAKGTVRLDPFSIADEDSGEEGGGGGEGGVGGEGDGRDDRGTSGGGGGGGEGGGAEQTAAGVHLPAQSPSTCAESIYLRRI